MNPYLVLVVIVLLLEYLLSQSISFLELRSSGGKIPDEFKDVYNQSNYQKSQEYLRVTSRFAFVQESFMLVVVLLFIFSGGFNRVDLLARAGHLGPIGTGLIFSGLLALLSTALSLPFSLYSTFIIEERFGLNRTTFRTFSLDVLKIAVLSLCLGAPLLAMVFWFFQVAGELGWLYCWGGVTVSLFILQVFAPVVIMPLFNKFTPLVDGELKLAITEYANSQQFAMKGVYTMDGSRRSTRLNAFFTGFGRFRRIVFFDTLIEKLTTSEIVAVLAHEMGHYKHKHLYKMLLASILQTGVMFLLLSLFLGNRQLFDAFGMQYISIYASLLFFGFLYSPLSTLLAVLFNFFSRKHEYEADAWAVQTTGTAQNLINGLKKLSRHNLSNLTPHPLNVVVNYSHPPVLQRIRAINKIVS